MVPPSWAALACQIVNEIGGFVLECLHDMWLVACMLLVAGCSVVARRLHSNAGCLEAVCCLSLEFQCQCSDGRECAFAVHVASRLVDGVFGFVVACGCLRLFVVVSDVGACYGYWLCCSLQWLLCLWVLIFAIVDTAL